MKIVVASDHAGFHYKQAILEHLQKLGHEATDYGTFSAESCDYPDFIMPAAQAVADGKFERGIVLGGSGNGEAIAANRIRGVRCAYCWSVETAQLGRKHNNANVIAIGERLIELPLALEIVDAWLVGEFEGGRHQRRIEKLDEFEG
ncbi:ribose 5-phosphate isomerase B [Blastopirellula sp. J2-11]|uniref:ribose 5-phosphate isomerase B n=1 Tax=Blastopirellula sp. J2-11 TaxID=2943192 RepID=UPI0021C8A79B|nr:ribose 5-phosphate isomerase B [Blastopirellula sp. J2-11]UUO07112.1 ribose 5-phosphate isomerase B [Blastopirellula sp. J2-11]